MTPTERFAAIDGMIDALRQCMSNAAAAYKRSRRPDTDRELGYAEEQAKILVRNIHSLAVVDWAGKHRPELAG